jgi:hypothetical protein
MSTASPRLPAWLMAVALGVVVLRVAGVARRLSGGEP